MTSSRNWLSKWLFRANSWLPTRRLAYIVAVSAAPALFLHNSGAADLYLTLDGAILCGLCVADIMSLQSPKAISASRVVPRLQVSERAQISVRVTLETADRAAADPTDLRRARIRDERPALTEADVDTFALQLPWGDTEIAYDLVPLQRGALSFGNVHVRLFGRFGLLCRQYRAKAQETVTVWPDLRMTSERQAAVDRVLLREGSHLQRTGSGQTEFSHIGNYATGDDPRHINWHATARKGFPMKNVYQPERGQHIILAIDCGRSMGVIQQNGKTRLDLALEAALLLAGGALKNGDEVSAIAYSDHVHTHVRRVKGEAGIRELVQALSTVMPHPVYAGVHTLIDIVFAHYKRRSLLLLFSDLTDLAANDLFLRSIAILERRHSCLVASFTDEALEDAIITPIRNVAEAATVGTAAGLLNQRREYREQLTMRGIDVVETRTELLPDVARAYARFKNTRRS